MLRPIESKIFYKRIKSLPQSHIIIIKSWYFSNSHKGFHNKENIFKTFSNFVLQLKNHLEGVGVWDWWYLLIIMSLPASVEVELDCVKINNCYLLEEWFSSSWLGQYMVFQKNCQYYVSLRTQHHSHSPNNSVLELQF